jgi:large subunit ribosomal protein L4
MVLARVVDMEGQKVSDLELAEEVFSVDINEVLMQEVIKNYQVSQRQGTASTKNRSAVRGGGIKPWRQKGTGRARAGSIRSPLWRGGGTVFGPTPKDFFYAIPRKKKARARVMALADKARQSKIVIVEGWEFDTPSTRRAKELLDRISAREKVLLILDPQDRNSLSSFRNLDYVKIISPTSLNTYDIVDCDVVVIPQHLLDTVVEVCR